MTTKNNIPQGYKQTELGIIPREWEVKLIKDICEVDAKSLSAKTSPDYEFEYISLSDVGSDLFDISTSHQIFRTAPSRARRIVSKGDVVISTVRPNLQGFFLVKEDKKDLIASTGFAVLTPTECDSQYLLSCFFSQIVSKQFYSLMVGSNYPAVNSSDVAKLKLAVPPLAEQKKIAEILGIWDEAIEKQSRLIEKLELWLDAKTSYRQNSSSWFYRALAKSKTRRNLQKSNTTQRGKLSKCNDDFSPKRICESNGFFQQKCGKFHIGQLLFSA